MRHPAASVPRPSPRLSPWRFIATFGVVAMLADVVYEGARSVTGPLLASLGASAFVVGLVTGVGEAAALVLRLVSGPLADRSRRFWSWVIAGYAVTAIAVPLLGLATTLWVAAALIIAERVGKAIRSPAKDTLLSHATATTGRGRGFAVHEVLDQVGALAGPLLVAAILGVGGGYRAALLALAVPGALALTLLGWLRVRVPHPVDYEPDDTQHGSEHASDRSQQAPEPPSVVRAAALPGAFWGYAAFAALTTTGFATFGVLSYHLVTSGALTVPMISVLYAAVMAIDAVAALTTGWAYDKYGPGVLLGLPVVAAAVPALGFSSIGVVAIVGSLAWGVALGIQESTLRATLADLVPAARRATAFGVFGAIVGLAAAAGGALAGGLYDRSVPLLVAVTALVQLAAAVVLLALLRARRLTPPMSRATRP